MHFPEGILPGAKFWDISNDTQLLAVLGLVLDSKSQLANVGIIILIKVVVIAEIVKQEVALLLNHGLSELVGDPILNSILSLIQLIIECLLRALILFTLVAQMI